ncbi:MAG: hypothetical protein HS108_03535 [Planctomycetes bacterium]|jgi:homoaconitase/3-isopropylmalate dehydratase large subunit|nr:hypothetical protein [Planctomycetota bacterium]MCL4730914.1 hypothetical protein [Planctomycetota bacterium]
MPHAPQTALVRLIQAVTGARNIAPGDRVAVRPHAVLLTDHDAAAALDACGDRPAPGVTLLAACRDAALRGRAAAAGARAIEPGCELAALTDESLVVPGECAAATWPAIAALGGMGALGLRLTPRDLGALLCGRAVEISVPPVIRLELTGTRQPQVGGRDLFLSLRREFSPDRLAGCALEVYGPGLGTLRLFERAALCSMAVHAGLFALWCAPDRAAVAELNARAGRPYVTLEPEKGAVFARAENFDLGRAVICAVPPAGVDAAAPIAEFHGTPIRHVIIGGDHSCGLEVLRQARQIIQRHKPAPGMILDLVPDSAGVLEQARAEDIAETLADLGARWHAPGTPVASLVQPDRPAAVTTLAAPAGCWRLGPFCAPFVACAGMLAHPERLDALPQRDSKLSARRPKPG